MIGGPPPPPGHPNHTNTNHRRISSRDTGFAQGIAIGQFDEGGLAISIEQVKENYRRKGLCVLCGKVKTHTKKTSLTNGFYMAPLTKDKESYEGYCLKCHTLEEVLDKPEIRAKLDRKKNKKAGKVGRTTSASGGGNGGNGGGAAEKGGKKGSKSDNSNATDKENGRNGVGSGGRPASMVSVDDGSSEGGGPRSNRSLTLTGSDVHDHHNDGGSCPVDLSSLPRGMDDIVQNMLSEPSNALVQARGCAELSRMANHPSDFLIGAIDAIIDAMNAHPKDERVQKEGCRAFRRYTTRPGSGVTGSSTNGGLFKAGEEIEVNADTASKISIQGGVHATLSSLRNFSKSRTIQREGIRVLRNVLCALADGKRVLVDSQGIDVVLQAMWNHESLVSVQEDGCIILWSVSYDDPDTQSFLLDNAGVPAILNAMRNYGSEEMVQYHGCGALHTLSSNEFLKSEIMDNGGFDVIVKSLNEHGYSEAVAEKACGALVNLVISTGGGNDTGGGGGQPQRIGRCASTSTTGNKLCVMNDGEIAAVIDVMQTQVTSQRVQRIGCYFLEVAARSRSNLRVLQRNAKIRSVLIEATENFPEDCLGSANYVLSMVEGC